MFIFIAERKDGGRNKNSKKSNSTTGEGFPATGLFVLFFFKRLAQKWSCEKRKNNIHFFAFGSVGNQKERAQTKVQEMFTSENEKSPSETTTQMASSEFNIGG